MVVATALFELRLPVAPLVGVLAGEACLNVVFHALLRRATPVTPRVVAAAMSLDLVILTALLYFAGGPMNPFNFLYLVHIALAAMLLRPTLAVGLAIMASILFALLFVDHVPLDLGVGAVDAHAHHHHGARAGGEDPAMLLHTQGMWVAFVVAAAFIVFFTSRIRVELDRRARAARELELRAERGERLGALATLAAGAAHELATPLSTIAVAARELELAAQSGDLAEEASVIRREVERCRDVLGRLATDAGRPRGEGVVPSTVGALIRRVAASPGGPQDVAVEVSPEVEALPLSLQLDAVVRALRGLVDNALLASPGRVRVVVERAEARVVIAIEDRGPGIDAVTLARIGEPFFTTRPGAGAAPGQPSGGMGLGVFVARNTLAEHGGSLRLESTPGVGTRAVVELPLAPPHARETD